MNDSANDATVPTNNKQPVIECWRHLGEEKIETIVGEIYRMLTEKIETGEASAVSIEDPKVLALPFYLSSRLPDGFDYFYAEEDIHIIRNEINQKLYELQQKKTRSWSEMPLEERELVVENAYKEAKMVRGVQNDADHAKPSAEEIIKLVQLHHSSATEDEVVTVIAALDKKGAQRKANDTVATWPDSPQAPQ